MYDFTSKAPDDLKAIVQDAISEGYHRDFDNFFDFLRACVDHYEHGFNFKEDISEDTLQ